ncbi:hypothetical protein E2C01_056458 [Portunus trituberculatus]|uniref:Uncharacterized protein n=1 Tax=Portunus trituberculatus TaxID=210409 RepID=A0A5B7GU69_PORTR|nr:hypothetical protein [Portunus trituberculatus]
MYRATKPFATGLNIKPPPLHSLPSSRLQTVAIMLGGGREVGGQGRSLSCHKSCTGTIKTANSGSKLSAMEAICCEAVSLLRVASPVSFGLPLG